MPRYALPDATHCGLVMAVCQNDEGHPGAHWNPQITELMPFGCLGPECHLIDPQTGKHVGSHEDDTLIHPAADPLTEEDSQ